MLRRLIAFCLLRRPLVLIAFGAFLGLGFVAFTALNIEAYPDPAPPIIEIIAQRPGQSPEEMERYVTIPIEIAIASTPGLRFIRSNTVYALSFIRLQFEYGRDYHFVRQQTINRLREADLPQGVQPVISPAGTISEIFRYELKGPPGMDVLRELENISVGHGVSLLCWRSGGVEHPHDTPPYPFTPSPTFAHSSVRQSVIFARQDSRLIAWVL
jgi:heavy metal efflux system protein